MWKTTLSMNNVSIFHFYVFFFFMMIMLFMNRYNVFKNNAFREKMSLKNDFLFLVCFFHDDHDAHDDHDERQRPLPRPLKEVQRRENRNFFKKNVPEKWHYFLKKYLFIVLRNDFYEKSRFWLKNTIRLLLEHVLEYPHKKLHRIAFFMLEIDSTMLKLWSFLIST